MVISEPFFLLCVGSVITYHKVFNTILNFNVSFLEETIYEFIEDIRPFYFNALFTVLMTLEAAEGGEGGRKKYKD